MNQWMTQEDLAKAASISVSSLSKIERGTPIENPGIKTLLDICLALHMDIQELAVLGLSFTTMKRQRKYSYRSKSMQRPKVKIRPKKRDTLWYVPAYIRNDESITKG